MKESVWLQKYEKEVKTKRDKSNQSKKVIFIIIPVMLLLCVVAAMANGGMNDSQSRNGILCMVGVFVFIMIFVIIMTSKGKKIDATKKTRENVLSLLKTDKDVDYFDQQMNASPVMEVKVYTETTVFLTIDYVGMRFLINGDLQYRFARRNDVAALDYCKTASAGANPMRASYFFDIKNVRNEIMLQGTAETGEKLGKLEEMLRVVQPNLVVTNKKGIL